MRQLLWFTYFLIAYGSLFPFDFSLFELQKSTPALLSLKISGIGDLLGNILLFIPLGLMARLNYSSSSDSSFINSMTFVWIKVFVFALILQLLQIALPSRDQNLIDVLLNMIGFALGFYSFLLINIPVFNFKPQLKHLPIAIGLTYFLSELSPFVPSFDFQGIKDSIKPLLIFPSFSLVIDVFIATVIWLLVIRLLSFQLQKTPTKVIFSLWLTLVFAKTIIYFNYLSFSLLIAPVIAIILTMKINIMSETNTKKLFWLVLFVLGVSSIAALGNTSITIDMFVPFQSYLNGQIYQGVQTLFYKFFLFSGIIWLAIELDKNAKITAINLAIYIAFIEILQLFMPTRTFDLGDIILVAFSYLAVRNIGDYLASECESENTSDNVIENKKNELKILPMFTMPSNKNTFIILGLSFIIFYFLVNVVLSLPGLPNNVTELFQNKGSIFDLFFFFIFLLLLGGGSSYIVEKLVNTPSLTVIKYVSLNVATLFLLFFFLWCSVTTESLEDILGASKFSQAIYSSQTSDNFTSVLLNVLSLSLVAKLGQFIEFSFRSVALFGLFQLPLVIALMYFKQQIPKITLVKFTVVSVFLFTLCFYVVFITAVTDNLTELIASPLNLSLSIVLLMFLVAFQRQLIINRRNIIAFNLVLLVGVLSWFVVQFGFELVIIKYGFTFSAFDFLIGAGRENKLTGATLILRWSILVITFQLVLLFGIQIFKSLSSVNFNSAIKRKISTYAYFTVLSVLLIYLGNRLFGESMHWQTITHYYTDNSQQPFNIDESIALVPENFRVGTAYLNGEPMESLKQAFEQAKSNDTVRLTTGYYQEAAVLSANNVSIFADSGAIVFGKAAQGKGALVIKGDNTYIENLECHSIFVPDNNGVCIRLEGKGITLNNVYFHHAQGGLLGSKKGGDIRIENSRFEHLGDGAFYHGIYTLAPSRLFINNSHFLNTRNGGHEIKSRSTHTEVTNSIIAASQSRDSRLIDVPNGGVLIIKNNILIEGPFSDNHDLLSWGVEGILHSGEKVIIEGNTIISDKSRARLISLKRKPEIMRIEGNIVIGNIDGLNGEDNVLFKNRAELSILPAPFIPSLER